MGNLQEKLERLAETKDAIKSAIIDKGGEVSANDTFYSYAEKISGLKTGGDGGGDLVYAENKLGRDLVLGEKVLLCMSNTTDGIYSGEYFTNTVNTFFCYDDDVIIAMDQARYSNQLWKKFVWDEDEGEYVLVGNFNLGSYPDLRFPFCFDKQGRCYFHELNSASVTLCDYKEGRVIYKSQQYYVFNDDYLFNCVDGSIWSADKSQSFATGWGDIGNSQKMEQIFGDVVVLTSTDRVMYVDLTNFPDCTTTTVTLPITGALNYGATGADIGDYCISYLNGTVYFLKRTALGFEVDFARVCSANPYFQQSAGVVSGYDPTVGRIFAYRFDFETHIWEEIILPEDAADQSSYLTSGTIQVVVNRSGSCLVFSKQNGGSADIRAYYKLYKTAYGNGKPVVRECLKSNFSPLTSYTGIFSGNVDEEGLVEIKTVLPETAMVTLEITPDVAEDEYYIAKADIQ